MDGSSVIRPPVPALAAGVYLLFLMLVAGPAGAAASGDVDGSGGITLADTILSLQVCAQRSTTASIDPTEADINGDSRIGPEEVIFTLQVLSALRSSPFTDWDQDGHSVNGGDCDDYDYQVYPGAADSCGDGVVQACIGEDPVCPAAVTHVDEDFTSGPGGFTGSSLFTQSGGRLTHPGSQLYYYRDSLLTWNGGSNPSNNWKPKPEHSNYFSDYHVSVDTYWGEDYPGYYGLTIDRRVNDQGEGVFMKYYMWPDGWYQIHLFDGEGHATSYAQRSFLRLPEGQGNNLAVEKEGSSYRFYLNGTEVARYTIPGFPGGGLGLAAHGWTNVSFDNFRVTDPQKPAPPGMGFPHVTVSDLNGYVHKVMTSSYYWYRDVPQVDPSAYPSPYELLEALKSPLDMGSFVVPLWWFYQYMVEGIYLGLGLDWDYDENDDFRITYVIPDSPADAAGLARGDKVLEIDGHAVEAMDESDLYALISNTIDESEDGDYIDLKIETAGGTRDVPLLLTEVTLKPVLHHEIMEHNGKKVGYLVFQDFIYTATEELTPVFAVFDAENIDELVLDLRYNGGGFTFVSQALASTVIGDPGVGKIFAQDQHNDKYSDWDEYYPFEEQTHMLDLDRLFVITTGSTASASELVINSLRPFIDVVTIGDTTYGKPMGMHGYDFYGYHVRPIEYKSVNADGEGDYMDGIPPTCPAVDDLTRDFGDAAEASLSEALNYIATGACSTRAKPRSKPGRKTLPLEGFRMELGAF